jgi:bacteriocin biosynthesis cyclodehydratase domain-containing protein
MSSPPATRLRRPRLKSTLDHFVSEDGTLYILRPGADEDIAVHDASPAQQRLLDRLRDARDVAELRAEFEPELPVDEVLGQLLELGLLEDTADDDRLPAPDRERYDRQLAYFSEIASPGTSRAECQRRLADSRVTIVGVGGLGSWAALALACTGVGRIDLVDGDVVDLSNLNRQVLYGEADLGQPKAHAAAAALRRFNPGIDCRPVARRVESADDVRAIADGTDLIVGTADWPTFSIGQWINQAAFGAGVPWIGASQFPPLVRVGPTLVPGRTGCLDCQESVWRAAHPHLRELEAQGRLGSEVAASFGPACGLVGSLIASDAVHLLTGIAEPATLAAALVIDLRTAEVTREPVTRIDGCATCGRRVTA